MRKQTLINVTFALVAVAGIASGAAALVYRTSGYQRRPDPHPDGLIVIDQDYQDRNPDNGVSDGGFPE